MRTAEEILQTTGNGVFTNTFTGNEMVFLEDAIEAINEARKEAILECAEQTVMANSYETLCSQTEILLLIKELK